MDNHQWVRFPLRYVLFRGHAEPAGIRPDNPLPGVAYISDHETKYDPKVRANDFPEVSVEGPATAAALQAVQT